MRTEGQAAGTFRSGVAARLSGVPVDTLRIWERRYSVIGPKLSAGRQRLYSMADIRRLTMIKKLVDMGHPIGTVASLGTDDLLAIQAATWPLNANGAADSPPKERRETAVALVGALMMGDQFVKALSGGVLRVAGCCADLNRAALEFRDVRADIVIISLASLSDADVARVTSIKDACAAQRAIVLYRFASSALIRRIRMAGHSVARATTDPAEIEAICLGLLSQSSLDYREDLRLNRDFQPRPSRFDEQFLGEISNASRTIECECPKHIVELVLSLAGFERYSAECASRNPSDVILHLDLQRAAGMARSIMERALERVAIAEGIQLPASAVNP
jgi:MerR family transcriptional regulator, light-induced transcriptional regulator